MAKTRPKKEKKPDITFFHPDLFEVPADGTPPFLKGYRCKQCGQLDFPKPDVCYKCMGKEFEMTPLSRRGKLYSYADCYVGQGGMETPYVIGYIDLPEDLRIFSVLEGEVESFRCDEELEVTAGTLRLNKDGIPITTYKFKKVND